MEALFFIFLIILMLVFFDIYKEKRNIKKKKYIDNYQFPKEINEMLVNVYPDLTENDTDLIIEGLKEYFKLYVIANRRTIVMPSRLIDRAWHEFILSTQEYQLFCHNAFEVFLHHAPVKSLQVNTNIDDLKIVWKLACQCESINPMDPEKLPLIFSLDAKFNIEDGFKYSLECLDDDFNTCAKNIACLGMSSAYGGRNF